MFNSILLPIDLQHEESWRVALPAAQQLLAQGGTLHLLAIVLDVGNAWVASYLPRGYEKKALTAAKARLGDLVKEQIADATDVVTHVGLGHVAETIITMAEKTGSDLIVMNSRSPDEMRTFRISSQADRVVRHSPVSVLIVR